MNKFLSGILSGLAATIVLSLLMFMKGAMGLMPDVNIIAMLASKMGGSTVMGWVAHFILGSFGYGIVYTLVFSKLPFGGHVLRGILLGVTGWLVMMLALMPMMGAGLFGMGLPSAMMVPVATLILHIIFGAVLGFVYSKL